MNIAYGFGRHTRACLFNSCSNHWICTAIDVKEGMAWVMDPLYKDEATYKDFLSNLYVYICINNCY
jgi:hypothetical protein